MDKSALDQEIYFNEDFIESKSDMIDSEEENNEKILQLYRKIKLLKETFSHKILKELKICKKSCEDANIVIGELNGDIKK